MPARPGRLAAAALLAVLPAAAGLGGGPLPITPARPNVLVILVDDLGWADTAPYGSVFHDTPAIDRLARGGTRFTQFYSASPVCSPTRASLMTGKHPARLHITDWIGGRDKGPLLPPAYHRQLPLEEQTIGEAFREAGYATGYLGKWHLGDGAFMPSAQGFGFTKAVNRAGQPASFFFPYQGDASAATDVPDLADGAPGEYLTDRLTTESIRFIESHRDRPFFLVVSHYGVHTPLQAPQALRDKYDRRARSLPAAQDEVRPEGRRAFTKLRQDHAVYAAMVDNLDTGVGRLLDGLAERGLADDTIVVFVSDNGGLSTLVRPTDIPTSNEPLRAGKGWLYEGGVRVPFVVRWPRAVGASRTVETPAMTTDIYPTLLALAGLPARPGQHVDGIDLSPLLRGAGAVARDELFWHFPHYHGSGHTPAGSVRAGRFKLIEWFEDDRVELYDLEADPGELHDLAGSQAARASDLRARLHAWRAVVGALMPTRNPDWRRP